MTESFLPGNRELHDALRKQLELLQQLKRHRGMLQHEYINVRVCVPDGRNRSRRTCYAPIKIEALCVAPNVFLIFYPHKVMYATPRHSLWPAKKRGKIYQEHTPEEFFNLDLVNHNWSDVETVRRNIAHHMNALSALLQRAREIEEWEIDEFFAENDQNAPRTISRS